MSRETDFENLYKAYYHSVSQYVSNITRSSTFTEDVVQETFLEAWKQFAALQCHPNPAGWLMRTACNKLRNMQRKLHLSDTVPLTEGSLQISSGESTYELKELFLLLETVCTNEERLLFRRYYLSGYTPKEIAAFCGITENNVRVRISRLTQKLRKQQ